MTEQTKYLANQGKSFFPLNEETDSITVNNRVFKPYNPNLINMANYRIKDITVNITNGSVVGYFGMGGDTKANMYFTKYGSLMSGRYEIESYGLIGISYLTNDVFGGATDSDDCPFPGEGLYYEFKVFSSDSINGEKEPYNLFIKSDQSFAGKDYLDTLLKLKKGLSTYSLNIVNNNFIVSKQNAIDKDITGKVIGVILSNNETYLYISELNDWIKLKDVSSIPDVYIGQKFDLTSGTEAYSLDYSNKKFNFSDQYAKIGATHPEALEDARIKDEKGILYFHTNVKGYEKNWF